MKPFSIAGIQLKVSAAYCNLDMMKFKLDVLMSIYPWVDMVLFSELSPYGPLTHHDAERNGAQCDQRPRRPGESRWFPGSAHFAPL